MNRGVGNGDGVVPEAERVGAKVLGLGSGIRAPGGTGGQGWRVMSAVLVADGDSEPVRDCGGDCGVGAAGAVASCSDAVAVHPEGEAGVGAAVAGSLGHI